MKLTVDASVVLKWFVTEPLSEQAWQLLDVQFDLHAPDILLPEFANTIWKKGRRGEIPDPRPYFDELAGLPGIVAIHPVGGLIERAAQIAVMIDHPVYDCLYLACAELTASALITADQQLVERAKERLPGLEVRHLGDFRVTGQTSSFDP
ncbi:MAG: type II toxin-antitoxin system VapC family toxin [Acidobacteriia bacterium]|nr:type II toxin-antitoxin system VapC family toxin [Terriglobia bacterium]